MAWNVMCPSTECQLSLQNTQAPQKTEVLLNEQRPEITHWVCSAAPSGKWTRSEWKMRFWNENKLIS